MVRGFSINEDPDMAYSPSAARAKLRAELNRVQSRLRAAEQRRRIELDRALRKIEAECRKPIRITIR